MRAVILAAGFGTRLAALGLAKPKALLEVQGRPALEWILLALEAVEGLEAVDLVVNAKFYPQFESWKQGHRSSFFLEILNNGVLRNEARLGAVGDSLAYLARQPQAREAEGLLLLASDNLWTMNLNAAVREFRGRGCSGCLLRQAPREELGKRGVARLASDGRLVELLEKPAEPPSDWVVPPVYYLTREAVGVALQYPTSRLPTDAIGHLPAWLCRRVPIFTYRVEGEWLDLGDLETYQKASGRFVPFGCRKEG